MTEIQLTRINQLEIGEPPDDNAQFPFWQNGDRRVSLMALRTVLVGEEQQVIVTPELTVAEPLSALRIGVVNANNQWVLASNTNPAHFGRVAGISVASWPAGTAARLIHAGSVFDATWNWTPGTPLWLGTGGQITATPPNPATAIFLQQLGVAWSNRRIAFHISQPLRIVS